MKKPPELSETRIARTQRGHGSSWRPAAVGMFVCVALGFIWLIAEQAVGPLSRLSYDWPFLFRPSRSQLGVAVVLMDEDSYNHFGEKVTEPWHRSRHAELLRQPCMTNARLVVLDVVLDSTGTNYWGTNGPAEDAALVGAIRQHQRVLLAGYVSGQQDARVRTSAPVRPADCFTNVPWGVAEFPPFADGAPRIHAWTNGLAWKAAQASGYDPSGHARIRWMNYPAAQTPARLTVSYRRVIEGRVDPMAFSNMVVFVGMKGPFLGFGGHMEGDVHPTPFTRWTNTRMSGVEIQATAFLNLVRGDWLTQSPPLAEAALVIVVGVLFGGGLCFFRPLPGALLGLAGMAALPLVDLWLVEHHRTWFPWAVPALVQIPLALGWSGLVHTRRLLREKEALATALAEAKAVAPPRSEARTELSQALQPTSPVVIADHTLLRKVGEGAYGEVWLARNLVGIYRAVKIIRRAKFADDTPYEREFRGIEKFMPISLKHPGLLQVLHVGQDKPERYFFYIMEAADDEVSGQMIDPEKYSPRNLHNELKQRKRLPLANCVELGLNLSGALAYLHDQQLIHRDLKPSNIVFVNGLPKIADVGLVTDICGIRTSVTSLGTPGYMAPEGPGTAAADVFSLGKVLYEAFTGLTPNRFPEIPSDMLTAASDRGLVQMNRILLRACESDPQRRCPSAEVLHEDLQSLQDLLRRVS